MYNSPASVGFLSVECACYLCNDTVCVFVCACVHLLCVCVCVTVHLLCVCICCVCASVVCVCVTVAVVVDRVS